MNQVDAQNKTDYIQLSQDLLYAARVGDSTMNFVGTLANASDSDLIAQLKSDDEKKAFFLNLYNAYVIILLKNDASLYENRNHFFGDKLIVLAKHKISLDNIEHGYLRKSEWKFGLGYIKKWFPSKFEKKVRVQKQDFRIHFALNCGANSCPAIAFYEPLAIDQELQLAEKVFVQQECKKVDEKTVEISSIFKWFKGDFHGKKGIVKLLKENKIIPIEQKHIKLTYKKYDWNMNLEKFRE